MISQAKGENLRVLEIVEAIWKYAESVENKMQDGYRKSWTLTIVTQKYLHELEIAHVTF